MQYDQLCEVNLSTNEKKQTNHFHRKRNTWAKNIKKSEQNGALNVEKNINKEFVKFKKKTSNGRFWDWLWELLGPLEFITNMFTPFS